MDAGALTEKLGPLPVFAWGLIGGALFLVVPKLVKKKAPSILPTTTPAAVAPAHIPTVPESSTANGSFMAAGSYVPGSTSSSTAAAVTTYASNEDWGRAAKTLIVSRDPSTSAVEVADAIDKVLGGSPVTQQQQAIFERAIGYTGFPPFPYPTITLIAQITTPVTATPNNQPPYTDGASHPAIGSPAAQQAAYDAFARAQAANAYTPAADGSYTLAQVQAASAATVAQANVTPYTTPSQWTGANQPAPVAPYDPVQAQADANAFFHIA